MAVMQVPRKQRIRQVDAPLEADTVDDLLRFRERFGFGHHHDEILEGVLVVSPLPVIWHEKVCGWLHRALLDVCDERGWYPARQAEVELPPNRDRIQPDLTVFRDGDSLPMMDNVMPLDQVLLVAEIISASSIRFDREVKPRVCALAGVPLYLLVDRFTDPLTISLHSEPGEDGYAKVDAMPVGGKSRLPAPFDLTLDTSALPSPR